MFRLTTALQSTREQMNTCRFRYRMKRPSRWIPVDGWSLMSFIYNPNRPLKERVFTIFKGICRFVTRPRRSFAAGLVESQTAPWSPWLARNRLRGISCAGQIRICKAVLWLFGFHCHGGRSEVDAEGRTNHYIRERKPDPS